jgi:hypothetical protein
MHEMQGGTEHGFEEAGDALQGGENDGGGASIAARLGLSMTYVAPCFIIRKIRTGLPMILTEPMTPITFDIIWFL